MNTFHLKPTKTLGLLRHTFSKLHSPEVKIALCTTLVRSQLVYGSASYDDRTAAKFF